MDISRKKKIRWEGKDKRRKCDRNKDKDRQSRREIRDGMGCWERGGKPDEIGKTDKR